MSVPPSPSSSTHTFSVPIDALAAAAERRKQQQPVETISAAQLAEEHEKRQAFRRLVDGIHRGNSQEIAFASIKTLSTIAENLLREPDDAKYQQFKPTNTTIKQRLVDPKGTLEYAIALGFYADVKNFQPYYVFNPRKIPELRIGAAILKESIDLETEKQERAKRNKVDEKAVARAIADKVKLAYMDDRKTKMLNDQREKERREARAAAAARHAAEASANPPAPPSPSHNARGMPGSGHVLGMDGPPPYDEEQDDGMDD